MYTSAFEVVFYKNTVLKEEYPIIFYADIFFKVYFWMDLPLQFTTASYDDEDDLVTYRKRIVSQCVRERGERDESGGGIQELAAEAPCSSSERALTMRAAAHPAPGRRPLLFF